MSLKGDAAVAKGPPVEQRKCLDGLESHRPRNGLLGAARDPRCTLPNITGKGMAVGAAFTKLRAARLATRGIPRGIHSRHLRLLVKHGLTSIDLPRQGRKHKGALGAKKRCTAPCCRLRMRELPCRQRFQVHSSARPISAPCVAAAFAPRANALVAAAAAPMFVVPRFPANAARNSKLPARGVWRRGNTVQAAVGAGAWRAPLPLLHRPAPAPATTDYLTQTSFLLLHATFRPPHFSLVAHSSIDIYLHSHRLSAPPNIIT
jgi:hypothetical protein